ncbi:hypothetical protein ACFU5Z_31105 [Streptomyces sp. NPDC057521]|uniref:hypothetical protein n=1 Tax=Streptomyces sp. NPDC057521 TaxID=3346156 RepID=UPI0036BFB4B1
MQWIHTAREFADDPWVQWAAGEALKAVGRLLWKRSQRPTQPPAPDTDDGRDSGTSEPRA